MSDPRKPDPVYLQACGMTTALGTSYLATAAAVRAGLDMFEESPVHNKAFAAITLSLLDEERLPELLREVHQQAPELTTRQIRMLKLATLALQDLTSQITNIDKLPIFLCGPQNHPNLPPPCHPDIIRQIEQQSDINLHATQRHVYTTGHAGGAQALSDAMQHLKNSDDERVLVAGIDSWLDLLLISTLDQEDRILAPDISDAFIPGEAACFLLVSKKPANFLDTGKQIKIHHPGIAEETGHRYSDQPYKGDGLALAFSQAFKHASLAPVKTIYSSINGEFLGSKEFGVANIRNRESIDQDCVTQHPADCFGDIGAATFPTMIALSAMGIGKEYLQQPVLCYASSDTQQRGATCMSSN